MAFIYHSFCIYIQIHLSTLPRYNKIFIDKCTNNAYSFIYISMHKFDKNIKKSKKKTMILLSTKKIYNECT